MTSGTSEQFSRERQFSKDCISLGKENAIQLAIFLGTPSYKLQEWLKNLKKPSNWTGGLVK